VVCVSVGFAGCNFMRDTEMLNYLADQIAMNMFMGDDALAWNVFSVTPEKSYGYVKEGEYSWYSYTAITDDAIDGIRSLLGVYKKFMRNINPSKLSAKDAITYRALDDVINTYLSYYGSPYAKAFTLIGGSYISSEGGYVADLYDTVENFTFRNEEDIKSLLELVNSTEDAFGTYLQYAKDRISAGYPLYDATIDGMRGYLNDVLNLGEEYYLYAFVDNKLDGATFLSDSARTRYKAEYKNALTYSFMEGVRSLYNGLETCKGRVTDTNKSYLAAYGEVGRAYYEWSFMNKTGMRNKSVVEVYNEIFDALEECDDGMQSVLDKVDALEDTNSAVYDEFYEYYNGEKVYLGLTEPMAVLDYLKTAAKSIVPDLEATPQIDFKYLDSTVEQIVSVLAYYLKSPLDEFNSAEHITLNGYEMANNPSDLLTTIAHEGYPGHLYAHVNAKEMGLSLLAACNTSVAFAEGWAMYVELAVLKHIAEETDSEALKLYCEYDSYQIMNGYYNAFLCDLQVNYIGYSVDDYVELGADETWAKRIIERLMENPAVYVSYGYGMYVINNLHDYAISELGEKYDEVEFNGYLLSDGFGPTLDRATQMTYEYVANNR
ncbi:MAG: DUF885 domain-containing protein, partial [Clostridia bacterium]|nr:DUF885 domain-containing protein [Clostridia bacterium]